MELPTRGPSGGNHRRYPGGKAGGGGTHGAGFASKDIKLYTGKQILNNQEVYIGRRSVTTKLVAWIFAEDVEGRELYLAYAREDRCAMWVRILDDGRVAKALRVLADFDCLHARYYGHDEQHDFHIS